MGGLLYKEYVSFGGKKIVKFYLLDTVGFVLLRVILRGDFGGENMVMELDGGQMVSLWDFFFMMAPMFIIMFGVFLAFGSIGLLVEGDKKNKVMNYVRSLPLKRNTYIASKYIFIVILEYVILTAYLIWSVIFHAFCESGILNDAMDLMDLFAPILLMVAMVMAAVELPLYIGMGKEKADMITTSFFMLVFFIVAGLLFFADCSKFSAFIGSADMAIIIAKINEYSSVIAAAQLLGPVFAGLLFYLSYRISCKVGNREVAIDG